MLWKLWKALLAHLDERAQQAAAYQAEPLYVDVLGVA